MSVAMACISIQKFVNDMTMVVGAKFYSSSITSSNISSVEIIGIRH